MVLHCVSWQTYLGLIIMAFYALGFSSLFLLIGFGVLNMRRLPRSGNWLTWLHHSATFVIFAFGLYQLVAGVAERCWGIYL